MASKREQGKKKFHTKDYVKERLNETENVYKWGSEEQLSTEKVQIIMSKYHTKDSSKDLSNEIENVRKWGSNEDLSRDTVQLLIQEGFTSMDLLYQLTPQMVKDSFQVPRLLPLAQCLALQKAVTRFPSVAQIDEGVRKWGENEGLAAETLAELARQGFDSVSKLHFLTPDVIMDVLIKQGKLQVTEGLLLRKALSSLPKDTRKTKLDTEHSQHVRESEDGPKPYSNRALTANAQTMTEEGTVLRLLLVGKSGSGISSTGNSILGQKEFRTGISSKANTERCESKLLTRNGFTIEVIDTPGFAHPTLSDEIIAQGIFYYTSQVQSAPLTILYVIKYGNYGKEDSKAYAALRKAFRPENYKHVFLAFTYCDELERNGDTIRDYFVKSGPELQTILQECRGRFIKVNNREKITTDRSKKFLSEIFKI